MPGGGTGTPLPTPGDARRRNDRGWMVGKMEPPRSCRQVGGTSRTTPHPATKPDLVTLYCSSKSLQDLPEWSPPAQKDCSTERQILPSAAPVAPGAGRGARCPEEAPEPQFAEGHRPATARRAAAALSADSLSWYPESTTWWGRGASPSPEPPPLPNTPEWTTPPWWLGEVVEATCAHAARHSLPYLLALLAAIAPDTQTCLLSIPASGHLFRHARENKSPAVPCLSPGRGEGQWVGRTVLVERQPIFCA